MNKWIISILALTALVISFLPVYSIFAVSPTSSSEGAIENQVTYNNQDRILASKIFDEIAKNSDCAKDWLDKGFWVPEGVDASDLVSPEIIKANFESAGLKNVPIPTRKPTAPGKIYLAKIKDQVSKGVYGFNASGSFESAATSKTQLSSLTSITTRDALDGHIHAGIWTNDFSYYGTINWVTTPDTVSMNYTTYMHVYCSHISNSSTGATWLETGYGKWTALGNSPVIYTWNGYTDSNQITYITVPDNSRNITREEYITNGTGTMYIYDAYSGEYIYSTVYNCGTGLCICVTNEEEYSPTFQFSASSSVTEWCYQVKNSSGNWVYWDNSISSWIGCMEQLANGNATGWTGTYRAVNTWITE